MSIPNLTFFLISFSVGNHSGGGNFINFIDGI